MSKILRSAGLWWAVGILLAGYFVMTFPFIPDDAFITFRYSKHLAQGLGPVYNAGEPVEGYTNFLWMLLMAIPHTFDWDVIIFARIVGFACHVGSVFLVWKMAKGEFQHKTFAGGLAILLLFQPTLLLFSGSGMETSSNLLLWMATIRLYQLALARPHQIWISLGIGAMLALCLLSRPDSIVLAAVLPLHYLLTGEARWRRMLFALAAASLILLPYLSWKRSFYGSLLPNTFISKSGGADVMNGLKYLALFSKWTLLPLAVLPWMRNIFRFSSYKFAGLSNFWVLLSLAWMAYMLYIGGDFMEFRMMAPAIPGLTWLVFKLAGKYLVRPSHFFIPLLILGGYQLFFYTFAGPSGPRGFVQPIAQLRYETGNPKNGLIAQAHALEVFSKLEPKPIMATGGAGAQPYYHDLPTIDMIGLNDARVAREGLLTKGIPGHARFATYAYLVERKVNVVVGGWPISPDSVPPAVIPWQDKGVQASFGNFDPSKTEIQPSLLLLPIQDSDWRLVTYYLWPHPGIDSLIQTNDWQLHPIR